MYKPKTHIRNRFGEASPASETARIGESVPAYRQGHALPGWSDIQGLNKRTSADSREEATFLGRISTARFALIVLGLGVLFTLYVGHVHATQQILAELEAERRENLRLHLQHNRLKGDFDQMVGPSVIYARAHELGLVTDPAPGPPIEVGE
ncbi:MAG: hypothetical protein F4Y00_10590 [Bacteroidetes bacterium SB0662_bin_6]|nr:hypothetical protein [Bacteroidetes bacterium SB0668_bin_1]MYE05402.1 hypothetical protein [Bacteroidetes bacterium SB0662_bin_6]